MLLRGNCRYCKRDYRSAKDNDFAIYRRSDGRWCCNCSGCGREQAYTRKDHAKQSSVADWQCKKCVAEAKGFNKNRPIGDHARLYNRFKKSAFKRGLEWRLSQEDMFAEYTGTCNLTGWPISIEAADTTASLDRIDSGRGYLPGNIQWVHTMVNMMKNKYHQDQFVAMCKAVAQKHG